MAGRLFASLGALPGTLPLGEDVWGDTALDLQFVPAGAALTNVLTGEVLEPRDGHLPLARAFRVFPGAVFHYQRQD